MKSIRIGSITASAAVVALAFATTAWAQSNTSTPGTPQNQSTQTPTPAGTPAPSATTTPAQAQPAPGTTPVGGDQPAPPAAQTPASGSSQPDATPQPCGAGSTDDKNPSSAKAPAPGTTPVGGDCAAPPPGAKKDKGKSGDDDPKVDPDKVIEPGSQMGKIKPGSIEDVNAVGNRDIGARGLGNWYSTDTEIKMGKMYSEEVEKSSKFITDPVVEEYVNRIGQNIVKNSDCKVPFTIKVVDSDEINAFALPGGFFYVNSGLILAADEEAELAGVMAHETAHVCAHHAVREMTRLNYAQLGTIPLIFIGGWTGYGIYEAASLAGHLQLDDRSLPPGACEGRGPRTGGMDDRVRARSAAGRGPAGGRCEHDELPGRIAERTEVQCGRRRGAVVEVLLPQGFVRVARDRRAAPTERGEARSDLGEECLVGAGPAERPLDPDLRPTLGGGHAVAAVPVGFEFGQVRRRQARLTGPRQCGRAVSRQCRCRRCELMQDRSPRITRCVEVGSEPPSTDGDDQGKENREEPTTMLPVAAARLLDGRN